MKYAREMGAVDYIKKPCKMDELSAKLGAIVGK
jgi:DNA-binding response OmpR family regulator